MTEQPLIDTSVWIDFFKSNETENVKVICNYLENDSPIFICPTIIQEILQGIKTEKEYLQVKDYLFALEILNDDAIEVALGAVNIYRKLRAKGITIRKSNDCSIAYYAIKYDLKILHQDRDFEYIMMEYRK